MGGRNIGPNSPFKRHTRDLVGALSSSQFRVMAMAVIVVLLVYLVISVRQRLATLYFVALVSLQAFAIFYLAWRYSHYKFGDAELKSKRIKRLFITGTYLFVVVLSQFQMKEYFDFKHGQKEFILNFCSREDGMLINTMPILLQEQLSRSRESYFISDAVTRGSDASNCLRSGRVPEYGGVLSLLADVNPVKGRGVLLDSVMIETRIATQRISKRSLLTSPVYLTQSSVAQLYQEIIEEWNLTDRSGLPIFSLSARPEANLLYLEGIESFNKRSRDDLYLSIDKFTEAIAIDQYFALAKLRLAETYIQLHISHWDQKDAVLNSASRLLQEVLRQVPDLPLAYVMTAKCITARPIAKYFILGAFKGDEDRQDLARAIDLCQKALEYDPQLYSAHAELIRLFFGANQNKRAHLEFSKAIDICPACPGAYLSEGSVMLDEGRYREAIGMFEKYISLRPEHGAGYYNLSCAYSLQGMFDAAEFFLGIAKQYGDYNYSILEKQDPDLAPLRIFRKDESGLYYSMR